MKTRWLNFYLRFSGYNWKLKQQMVQTDRLREALPLAFQLVVLEIVFSVIAIPLFFLFSPENVQEEGTVFPQRVQPIEMKTFEIRRRMSLGTIFLAGGLFVAKLAFVGIVSLYVLGTTPLLAAIQDWDFETSGEYTYDSDKIEITGGVAQLKNVGSMASWATTNGGFDSGSTGWTYFPNIKHTGSGTNTGNYQSSGGNPGGYIDLNQEVQKSKMESSTWQQAFTTTVNSPDTATVSFDWKSITYGVTPSTYTLAVYIDTTSGTPVPANQVWTSGQITGTTAWASVGPIDIRSFVPTAGTYYVKVVSDIERLAGSPLRDFYISGWDNVVVNWTKNTSSYNTTKPTIVPNSSLSMSKTVSWNGFTETATKNGGEIYYQLSDDNGSTWQYWNGTAWATAGALDFNTASVVQSNITSFSTTNNQILWKAFLSSDGSQQVMLDNISIDYTENSLPVVANVTPSQGTSTGLVYINYDLQDVDSDPQSLSTYEYSLTGAFAGEEVTMAAATGDGQHDGVSGLTATPAGTTHTFVWDAGSQLGAVYDTTVYVRLRANDGVGDSDYEASNAFAVDYVIPVVSNVSATQVAGSTNVQISYDLADDTSDALFVEIDISEDSGSTWTVTDTSVTGSVGSGQTTGSSKTITWNAGTDFDEQEQTDLQVRVRATDKWQNAGSDVASSDFAIDTVNPVTLTAANLQAQPNAGDTSVLIGGSFTESHPDTNDFYVAINGDAYGSATAGDSNTATPSNQATAAGITLDGNDVISSVKITHADDFGQTVDNETTSPTTAYKYVKPYTPQAPTLSNPVTTSLDLTINPHASETSGLEYALHETSTNQYVQANGTLGASAVWQVLGTSAGQWGNSTAVSGKVQVNGLSSPVANSIFEVKSRNTSDTAHASSSESAYSSTAQISNTAPSIALGGIAQTTDGTDYVTISYTGTDAQGDINSLNVFVYSRDNATWSTMTEKPGVGSDGTTNLTFLSAGSAHTFVWDVGTDLSGVEDSTVYVRLQSSDTLANSAMATSSAFEIDTVLPVISGVIASQDAGARTVTIDYTLTDANNALVELDISEDGGLTWTVTDTSVTGDVGSGVAPGSNTITWNAGADFDNQYQTDIQVRVRAKDTFGNQGATSASSNFAVDTNDPVVTNVTAVQDSALDTFTFHYDVSEDAGNTTVGLEISSNGGSTWVVPVTTLAGDVGSGIASATGKTVTWDGATDYAGFEKTAMKIRVTATDGFSNTVSATSANFDLDTLAPRVTGVSATQVSGTTNVTITYTLADQHNSLVELDISDDSGATWSVTDTSVSGDVGSGISSGSKTITWDSNADFDEQAQADMRVRVRAKDVFEHQSTNTQSADFALDTLNPTVNVTADLQAQPNAGDTSVLIGGSFTETNPNTNTFYVALNGGAYGSASAGDTNTSSPSNHVTPVGTTLDGNDYVSGVKIVHTDDFAQIIDNENTSPFSGYQYVKPYTSDAPTVNNPTVGTVDVTIQPNASETSGLEYAIFETSQSQYVQANGTLGASEVWQTDVAWGTVTVNGLANDSYTYQFKTTSRNTSDAAHAASSESALSGGASSTNQSPVIVLGSISQTTDATQYVTITYTGSDLESENSTIITAEYSTNGTSWNTMTEKAGVGSDGTAGLIFASAGTAHDFMWDVGTDLANTEDVTVYVRLQADDATSSGAIAESSAFTIDTKNPVISSVTAAQQSGSNDVVFTYTLTDLSTSSVALDISDDAGATWTVTDTSVTGDVGSGVMPGAGKSITWNPGTDFSGQEQTDLRVRIRATDSFGNAGTNASSSNFAVDTESPRITNVTASQDAGLNTVTIGYDIDDANTSDVVIEISEDNGSTWGVAITTLSGDVGAGVTSGIGKSVSWDAATDFPNREQSGMMVRVRATDAYDNVSGNVSSSAFGVDTLAPSISNVTASQTLGTDTVVFTYDLSDSGTVAIVLDISEDSGSTWTVTDTSVIGDVGSGQTPGIGKTISWDAGTDFDAQDVSTMRVRVRGTDGFSNASAYVESSDFITDTFNPSTNVTADIQSQPNAGDTTVEIGGSFTETNPNTNNFYVAVNDGAYGSATAGTSKTGSPANQATGVGGTLDGNDYISKVQIEHTDDYGHSATNENTSPTAARVFVKPYTPQAPTVTNAQNTSVDVTVVPHASETSGLEYAIYETTTTFYVQADGSLDTGAVWRTTTAWGTTTVTGLTSPVAQYAFEVKSRNTSDVAHASSSESARSASGAVANTAPSISLTSVSQQTATNYALIQYTGTDAQNDTNTISTFEYSTDNATWNTMTEKSGVGSDGTSGLVFASTGSSYTFAWDIATDLPNTGDSTVFVRLQSTDGLANSNVATSSAFAIDTLGPVVSNIRVSQTPATNVLTILYDLADDTVGNNTISLVISSDSGSTYTVPITSLSGDVGSSVSAGTDRSVSWNAGTDFDDQELSSMRVKIQGTDAYDNSGTAVESSDVTVDTKAAVVSSVFAAQVGGTQQVDVEYTLTDLSAGGLFVEVDISSDGGSTWTVTDTSVSGDVGTGQTTGSKSFSWGAGTDMDEQYQTDMRVRVRARDYFGNQRTYTQSSDFTVDTKSAVVANVTAAQVDGSTNVAFTYDLTDDTSTGLTVELDISEDNGATWTVTDTSVSGNIGASQTTGTVKTITWNADTDFDNQYQEDMMVRIRATDSFTNQGTYASSTAFAIDTANPIVSNVTAVQTAGTSDVIFTYNLVDGTATGLTVELDISDDNGFTWVVTDSAVTGAIGSGQTTGTEKTITWDAGTDFNDQFKTGMMVRIRATDSFTNQGNYASSSAFTVDTVSPVVSNVTASQTIGTNNVVFTYDLTDNTSSGLTVELDISQDNGFTWTVTDTSVTGGVGTGQSAGVGKTITWDAGADFDGQYQEDMMVRIRATDSFGGQGSFAASSVFILDTANPVVFNVTAAQESGSTNVTFTYDLTDNTSTNLTVELDISQDNGSTWTVADTSVTGAVGSGQSTGTDKTITWNADTDFDGQYQEDMMVRIRATDSFGGQGSYTTSSAFTLDTSNPVVSNVTAAQESSSTNVTFTYDLTDNTSTNLTVELDISEDNGSTWTVTDTSVTGSVGTGQSAGAGKTISWDAGADFDNQYQEDMMVRIRATDSFTNQGTYASSAAFGVDTKDPVILAIANLNVQPNAGDTTAFISGSFTEQNPNTNDFYVALNGGSYSASSAGDSDTATPTAKQTSVGETLQGDDYISSVKIVHTDDFGNSLTNENTSPNSVYKFVKPYTPAAPTVNGATVNSVNVTVNKNVSEVSGLEYAMFESSTGHYVQANGTLGASAVWQTIETWSTKTVTGLSVPVTNYTFKTKSRNTSDSGNAESSESALSAGASIDNTAPTITIDSVVQTAGQSYVVIDYTGTDVQEDLVDLVVYEYSSNGSDWLTMTEKTGEFSDGVSDLAFTSAGAAFTFVWDTAIDVPGSDAMYFVRLVGNDGIADSNTATSSAFQLDVSNPVVSNISAAQQPGSTSVVFTYDVSDVTSDLIVELDISSDNGFTWAVTDSAVTGAVGSGQTTGTSKTITWDAGTDFNNEFSSTMMVRIRATDSFNNQGSYASSSAYTLDTANPVVSNVTAAQNVGSSTVMFTYNLSDDTSSGLTVELDISQDNGATWTVADTSVTGAVGSVQSTGTDKIVTWDAGADFDGQYQEDMMVRIRATDSFGGQGSFAASSVFILDTSNPIVSNVTASQNTGSTNVIFTYNLTDNSSSGLTVELDISQDNGSTWTVIDTSVTGAVGSGQSTGTDKTITWNADTDFDGQYQEDMMVRIRATDSFGGQGSFSTSSAFTLDTSNPVVSNVTASQDSDSTDVTFTYDLTDNTSTNLTVELDISEDNGSTWTVTDTSVSGNIGSSQTTGTAKTITWNADTDFDGQYQEDMMVRIRATDEFTNQSTYSTSSAFTLDTSNPVVSNVTASQDSGSQTVRVTYDLSEDQFTNTTVEMEISDDNGSTWTVATTSAIGNIGLGQTPGTDQEITWNAGTDFGGTYQTDMMVRIRATDSFNNQGAYDTSTEFVVDTAVPVVTNVTASQGSGSTDVTFTYDLVDDTESSLTVALDISDDGGATWTVNEASVSSDIGTDQSASVGRVITWLAGTDVDGVYQDDMMVRIRAIDAFGNEGEHSVSDTFVLDTLAPVIEDVVAEQDTGTETVTITYDLTDDSATDVAVSLEISSDGGSTWTIPTTSATGSLGTNQTTGIEKTITWNAGIDFDNQESSLMRVRLSATDAFENSASPISSSDFDLDTFDPVGLANFQRFFSNSVSATLTWTPATDSHFDHYELWYGADRLEVQNRTGSAAVWNQSDDSALDTALTSTTTITGLTITSSLYVKIWAVDAYGHEITTDEVDLFRTLSTGSVSGGGGGGVVEPVLPSEEADTTAPIAPILFPVSSPTNQTTVLISGLAEPFSVIHLYESGVFIARLSAAATASGQFSQSLSFAEGQHVITARAIDQAGNESLSSLPLFFTSDFTPPNTPVFLAPTQTETTNTAPAITGNAEPLSRVQLIVDGITIYTIPVDTTGTWSFLIPTTNALTEGGHQLTVTTTDSAGNQSSAAVLPIIVLPPVVVAPPTVPPAVQPPPVPVIPTAPIIQEVTEAVELPGLAVPIITAAVVADSTGNQFNFSGTALPNAQVAVYVHSNQALWYQTQADQDGKWTATHSQIASELAPGDHTIYAVSIDTEKHVKSRPGATALFTVQKSLWVQLFGYLRINSTVVVLIIVFLSVFWLWRLKKQGVKHV